MALYVKLIQQAEATGQPARPAKIRGIRREVKSRISAQAEIVGWPTEANVKALSAGGKPLKFAIAGHAIELYEHGRFRANEMINRSLPYVVAYVPELDLEWPY